MPATAGNKFWMMRSKHGRKRIFEDPETMLKAAYEYFEFQSNQAWIKNEAVKGGEFTGQIIQVPTCSPFSLEGLCLFLDVNTKYFNHFESALKPNESDIDKDFSNIITRIREIIALQQFEGATVGTYNASIISRRLGLADLTKSEITGKDGGPVKTDGKLTIEMISTKVGISDSEKDIQHEVNRELGIENE